MMIVQMMRMMLKSISTCRWSAAGGVVVGVDDDDYGYANGDDNGHDGLDGDNGHDGLDGLDDKDYVEECCHLLLICCRFIVILGECIVPCSAIAHFCPLYISSYVLSISSCASLLYIFSILTEIVLF